MAGSGLVKWIEGPDKQRETFAYVISRLFIVFAIYLIATVLPSIDVILEVGGAILGTIINLLLPILFYNRAYSGEQKHLNKDTKAERRPVYLPPSEGDDEEDGLMEENPGATDSMVTEDKRHRIRMFNWVLFTLGVMMGIFGLV